MFSVNDDTRGDLAEHIAKSGDASLMMEFATMSRAQIRRAEALWRQRNQAVAAVASTIGAQTAALRELRSDSADFLASLKRREAQIARLETPEADA